MIEKTPFGTLEDGRTVEAYVLSNAHGMTVTVITWGGIVTSIRVPDRDGRLDDVVLGFDELAPYLGGHPFFGAITGRVAGKSKSREPRAKRFSRSIRARRPISCTSVVTSGSKSGGFFP